MERFIHGVLLPICHDNTFQQSSNDTDDIHGWEDGLKLERPSVSNKKIMLLLKYAVL